LEVVEELVELALIVLILFVVLAHFHRIGTWSGIL
jgi:hypothetical protein